MPLPEGYLPREGDVLVFHATVKYDVAQDDEFVHVKINGYGTEIIALSQIADLHSRHWNEGDKVRSVVDRSDTGEVIATHEDCVWVKSDQLIGLPRTFRANDLEAAPDANPVSAAIAAGRAPSLEDVAAVIAEPPPFPAQAEENPL